MSLCSKGGKEGNNSLSLYFIRIGRLRAETIPPEKTADRAKHLLLYVALILSGQK